MTTSHEILVGCWAAYQKAVISPMEEPISTTEENGPASSSTKSRPRSTSEPMIYSRGKLYRLEGLERIDLVRGGPLRFLGWLEADTIHFVDTDS